MKTNKSIRIISTKHLSDDLKEILTEENGCYYSNDKKYLLITNVNKFDFMGNPMYINDRGKKYTIHLYKIGSWVKLKYKNKHSNFFNQTIFFSDFSGTIEEMCDQFVKDGIICINGWEKVVDHYLKFCVMVELVSLLEINTNILTEMGNKSIKKELQQMEILGYESNILRNEIERILNKIS